MSFLAACDTCLVARGENRRRTGIFRRQSQDPVGPQGSPEIFLPAQSTTPPCQPLLQIAVRKLHNCCKASLGHTAALQVCSSCCLWDIRLTQPDHQCLFVRYLRGAAGFDVAGRLAALPQGASAHRGAGHAAAGRHDGRRDAAAAAAAAQAGAGAFNFRCRKLVCPWNQKAFPTKNATWMVAGRTCVIPNTVPSILSPP